MSRTQLYDAVISEQNDHPARRPVVQARALATRHRILDQAAIAFARDGYDAASLTGDILEPAGVSVGSFYHQFDNKLDVLFALLRERIEPQRDDADTVAESGGDGSLRERLTATISWLLDQVDEEPELCTIQLRERWNPDPQVRNAVIASWGHWRAALQDIVVTAIDDASVASTGARMLGRTLVSTLGTYLDTAPSDRAGWRGTELSAVVEFCAAGLEGIADRAAS